MPQTCLLNSSVSRLGKSGPNDVVCICNRAILMSLLDLAHFLNVHFINLIQALTCPHFGDGMPMTLLALH